MSSKLEIEYPENLPDVLQTTRARFEQEAKMAMAVKLLGPLATQLPMQPSA